MKKIIIFTVFWCCCFSLQAQITQAEYFIDSDPGQGSATVLIAGDGAFDGILESAVNNAISLSGLGYHSINVRVKDTHGTWGPVFTTIIHVENPLTLRNIQITQGELFFDTDPGQGSGTAMVAYDGNFDNAIESVLNNPLTAPALGLHKLNVRVKDIAGSWGPVFKTVIKVENLLTPRDVAVTAAELFWDTDPGQGSGIAMIAYDGNFDNAIESVLNNPLTSPTLGFHKLNVRVKDIKGNWGPVFKTVIHVENIFAPRTLQVSAAELFWDTDPGQGSGIAMVAYDGNYSDAIESVLNNPLTTPALGFHKLNVRVKDVKGNWGPVFKTIVHVENIFAPRDLKIIAGEMFFDADPGQGNGIAMLAFDGNYNDAMEEIVKTTSYLPNPGYHALKVRVKDVKGAWGPVFTVAIHFLPCSSSPTPTFSSAGNATNICSGDSLLLTASGSFSTYTWFQGNTQVGTGQAYYAKSAGSYKVYVTDNVGCPGYSSSLQIGVTNLTPVITPLSSVTFCQGSNVALDAGTGYTSYSWSSGQTTQTITVSVAGTFSVTVSSGGCTATAVPVTTVVNSNPTVPVITLSSGDLVSSSTSNNQWYLNGNIIPGATGQTYTPTQNGSYTVVVTNGNGCSSTSVPYFINSTGITKQQKDSGIIIYPIPAIDKLYIISSEKITAIKCTDYLGQLIDVKQISNYINISALSQGVYFLNITNEKGDNEIRRFVKQ